jgi:16S rRNA (adenine1518-N6/adenine1519-N6)-dimethyltransferase
MKLTNISNIKRLIERHGFSFTKSLGQNFLINPSVCPRMAATVGMSGITLQPLASSSGTVIEIGAGIGVLTRELSNIAEKVIVIEIDKSLEPILSETLADCNNIEIIWSDVLKLDLRQIISDSTILPVSIVANLPYYVATNIIMRLLEVRLPISTITVMVQEEVAQRFTAQPGSKQYGIVSIAARFYSQPKMLFKVSRGSFIPSPNVDSAVIQLTVNKEKPIDLNEKQFFRLVKVAFSERRKQLCNPVSKEFGITKSKIQTMLKNPNARAEDLSVDDFIDLYRKIKESC